MLFYMVFGCGSDCLWGGHFGSLSTLGKKHMVEPEIIYWILCLYSLIEALFRSNVYNVLMLEFMLIFCVK